MTSPDFFNGSNITSLILFFASIVGAVIGLAMLGKANKGRLKDNAEKAGSVLLAFAVIAGALGGMFYAFGEEALGFFIG